MHVPTPIDMSTPAGPWLEFFGLAVYGTAAVLGDSITTMIGLNANKGFIESNPIAAWMFKKVGQSLTCWLGGAGYLITAAIFASLNWKAGMGYTGVVAAAETYFAVHNYLLLKKLGISL